MNFNSRSPVKKGPPGVPEERKRKSKRWKEKDKEKRKKRKPRGLRDVSTRC
jgi:hypothetical protein